MTRRLLPSLIIASIAHSALWLTWPAYRYGFGLRLPKVVLDFVASAFRYRQIEDLPDAQAKGILIMGFLLIAAGGVAAFVLDRRRKAQSI
ncbi:MAG: hypothetical protein WBX15_20420 [Thermoanaerobaculia bacterium]